MSDDESPTPIICSICRAQFGWGTGESADRCPRCGRSLTPVQQDKGARRRSSGTFPGLERTARELAARLRLDARIEAHEIAERLELIAAQLVIWQAEPPPLDKSMALHSLTLTLVSEGEKLLAGPRQPSGT